VGSPFSKRQSVWLRVSLSIAALGFVVWLLPLAIGQFSLKLALGSVGGLQLQAIAIAIVVAALLSSLFVAETKLVRKSRIGGIAVIVVTAIAGVGAMAVCLAAIPLTGSTAYTHFSAPKSGTTYVAETSTWLGQTSVSIHNSYGPVFEAHWLVNAHLQEGYSSIKDGQFEVTESAGKVTVRYATLPGQDLDATIAFPAN